MKCNDCNHARATKNEDYVGCSYWYNELGRSGKSEESFAQTIYETEDTISNVALGWVFPHRSPHSKGDGTATSGLMWNSYYCIPRDDYCSKWE